MALSKFNPQLMHDDQLLPATLLEMGDTLNFIETRKHTLRNEIKTSKIDAGVGKVSGIAGIAGGGALLILSNPLGSLIVAGGAIAYSMAVFAQWLQTGKVQIMPLSSKTQAERDVELSSSTETGNAYDVAAIQGQRDSIREDAAYLSDREKVEYELLHFSPEGLLSAMNHVHPTQRWACYQFLVDAFLAGTIQSYFANPQALRDVLGNPAIYTSHLPEAAKRFPQYGLQNAGAIEGEEARSSFQSAVTPVIGANTQLNAVTVESVNIVSTQPRQEESKQLTLEQTLALPLAERADYIMKVLAEYGCDLRNLVGRPTLAAGGLQRSGKTTLIILLAILEKAKGQKIFYVTRDSDLYPISFDGYVSGSEESAIAALMGLSDRINGGQMGALKGETWILDEFSSTAKELDDKTKDRFWGMALTGFAKQGGRVRFIVHHKTAKANGLPAGEAETFKAEVKMFWTERDEMQDGTYKPSGLYQLLAEVAGHYKETGETFTIPEWLKSDVNPNWHNAPCPVRSLLAFFPELDTRKGAVAQPLVKPKEVNPFKTDNVIYAPFTSAYKEREQPCEPHEVDEEAAETTSSIDRIRSTFPQWKQRSADVAAVIVDWMLARSDKAFAPYEIRKSIRRLKDDPSLSKEKIETLLGLLANAQILSETDGKYSINVNAASNADDYDF